MRIRLPLKVLMILRRCAQVALEMSAQRQGKYYEIYSKSCEHQVLQTKIESIKGLYDKLKNSALLFKVPGLRYEIQA